MYKWLSIHTKNKKYPYFFINAKYTIDYLKNTVTIEYYGQTFKTCNIAIIKDFEAIMHSKEKENENKPK